jgi:hypothetical protein
MNRNLSLRLATLTLFSGFIVLLFAGQETAAQTQAPPPTSVDGPVATYGDRDLVGFHYPPGADPTRGARLTGLAPGAITLSTEGFGHGFPFKPGDNQPDGVEDYPNTDQIFVGSNQTAAHDGYAQFDDRKKGPALFSLDYSKLVPAGTKIATLTLGIAIDDVQFGMWGQPFSASVNGQPNRAISSELNKIDDTGPMTRFFSAGIDPAVLTPDHILTVAIDEGGDGGDGFAIDFLTVGVTTSDGASAPITNRATTIRQSASSSGPVTTTATVLVKDEQSIEIHLKPEEKIAIMFMEAISFLEDDCHRHLSRHCSLAELVAGPNSPNWHIDRLKYDPARDTNYKYTVTVTAHGWNASASPQRPGLGGLFFVLDHGIIVEQYFNPNGAASASDKKLGEISIGGEIFQVQ